MTDDRDDKVVDFRAARVRRASNRTEVHPRDLLVTALEMLDTRSAVPQTLTIVMHGEVNGMEDASLALFAGVQSLDMVSALADASQDVLAHYQEENNA